MANAVTSTAPLRRGRRGRLAPLLAACGLLVIPALLSAQEPDEPEEAPAAEVAKQVDVEPVAEDTEIAARLMRILEATEWFEQPEVEVDEGVVFLQGRTSSEQHKEWAGRLAGNTQDVVAVVNRIEVVERSMWDLSPAWNELAQLGAETVRQSPLIAFGLLLLVATWLAAQASVQIARVLLRPRVKTPMLRDIAARAAAVPVFLLGLYLILKVSGLTRLAVTVLGGTGLIGLVVGFAFRDIAENFLASILISMQHPFERGDLISVAGHQGYVQGVNTRSTLLMTLEGNHIQIPNATIYKETITNYTANPNARFDFVVGIGYDAPIAKAQSIALSVLSDHPAVVDHPEPLVLVEALGAATVNVRVYFWVNVHKHSFLKVLSSVIRLTKQAFDEAEISMPDEAREVVFPAGVPVITPGQEPPRAPEKRAAATIEDKSAAHSAEGDLASEAEDIEQQARNARSPEAGKDLLES
ncbi:MAG: BON domain-containing protein [Planctomycetota bacterium]|nr:MAG: BON domain-containing protein [Planctomycetota bacterium]